MLIYGSLNYYKNINSEETQKMKKVSEQLVSGIDLSLFFIEEKILAMGKYKIDNFILKNPGLLFYQFYINNLFRKREHVYNDDINNMIQKLNSDNNDYLTEYNDIIHKIKFGTIDVDKEVITLQLSNIGKYLSSKDRDTRKKAYISMNEAYSENEDALARILNSIYINRVKISKTENYSSVLEKSVFDENINPKILETLISAVHKNIRLMHQYLMIKIKELSIESPHLYDYGVQFNDDVNKKYLLADAVNIIKNALKPLGLDYLKIIDYLIDNQHIDALLNENKHQFITFSWSSYSFMNYREAYIDLKNLAHELGHMVNAYLSEQQQPYIYSDSTAFVGETASLVNELLLNKYLLDNAENDKEKTFYLSMNIELYFTQVFKQTMYSEFENKLYAYVENNVELTTELLKKEYSTLQRQYFAEFTNYDDCSSIEWTRLGHLYRWGYYVYKYATGLIMASSVTNSIINNEEGFIDKYFEFLASGGSDYSLNLLKKINVDLTVDNIITHSFDLLKSNIDEFNKILCKERKVKGSTFKE